MLARTPWTPPLSPIRRPPRRLNRARHRHLLSTVASILRRAQPTPFAYEGAVRHGIRSGLCLEGWRWHEADEVAAAIVATALRFIGAKRPTWLQGQREYAGHEDRVLCAHGPCHRPIVREPGEYQRRIFCSPTCRRAAQNLRFAEDHRAEAKAASQAWRDARRAAAAPKQCEWCGTSFRPLFQAGKPEPRFCGKSCATRWGNSIRPTSFGQIATRKRKPAEPPRPCLECGEVFRPDFPGKRFCRKLCSNRANSRKAHRPVITCVAEDVHRLALANTLCRC